MSFRKRSKSFMSENKKPPERRFFASVFIFLLKRFRLFFPRQFVRKVLLFFTYFRVDAVEDRAFGLVIYFSGADSFDNTVA